jgi:hypothetical protein
VTLSFLNTQVPPPVIYSKTAKRESPRGRTHGGVVTSQPHGWGGGSIDSLAARAIYTKPAVARVGNQSE